jgi:hypothetical protein
MKGGRKNKIPKKTGQKRVRDRDRRRNGPNNEIKRSKKKEKVCST